MGLNHVLPRALIERMHFLVELIDSLICLMGVGSGVSFKSSVRLRNIYEMSSVWE